MVTGPQRHFPLCSHGFWQSDHEARVLGPSIQRKVPAMGFDNATRNTVAEASAFFDLFSGEECYVYRLPRRT